MCWYLRHPWLIVNTVHDLIKAGVKVYLRQNLNFRSHAVSAWISLWCHRPMHACTACIAPWCHRLMQSLHGLCCFDFISDIPLLQLLCPGPIFTKLNFGLSVSASWKKVIQNFSPQRKNSETTQCSHQQWRLPTPTPPSYKPEGTQAGCSSLSSTEESPHSRPSYSGPRPLHSCFVYKQVNALPY